MWRAIVSCSPQPVIMRLEIESHTHGCCDVRAKEKKLGLNQNLTGTTRAPLSHFRCAVIRDWYGIPEDMCESDG